LILPSGFSLIGAFPGSIPSGGTANFTVRMSTATTGTRAGALRFSTNDPNSPIYSFNLQGLVEGGLTGALHGQIFEDDDKNGIENGAETGKAGLSVQLVNAVSGQEVATTVTSTNGYYIFLNLPAGTYQVRPISIPAGILTTTLPADTSV